LAHPFLNAWETPIGFQVGSWELARTLRDWINDGLMTLFFFLISLELKRSIVLGELRCLRIAALPILAAIGGMLVPALLYLMMQAGQPGQHGWGTVMASDTAFVIGCLALLGSRVSQQLRLFMLSLTIFDDIGAILVVTIGYSSQIVWPPLALAAIGIALMRAMTAIGFRGFPIYFFVGALIWLAVDASGVQATITGVVLGLMAPAHRWVSDDRLYAILNQVIAYPDTDVPGRDTRDRYTLQVAERAARETLSPLERLEILLHPWVGFAVIPLFAFANTGVTLSLDNIDGAITISVLVALVIGKPVGIILFSWLAVSSKIAARPPDVDWATLAGGGMMLYIANLSFGEDLIDSAKLGIFLASAVSALAGIALLVWATSGRTRAVPAP
jgi:NhaA family Na+:H+ antiporter